MGPVGNDTVVIRTRSRTTTRDRLNSKTPDQDRLTSKSGCLFEIQRPAETEQLATVDSEIAWVFLPVDDDTRAITTFDAIDFDGRTFEMRGPRAIERTLDGEEVQVWCTVQWQAG